MAASPAFLEFLRLGGGYNSITSAPRRMGLDFRSVQMQRSEYLRGIWRCRMWHWPPALEWPSWEAPWRHLRMRFAVSILLGLIVEIGLWAFHDVRPIPDLERFGQDMTFRALATQVAGNSSQVPKLVLVTVDDHSLFNRWEKPNSRAARPEIVETLRRLRQSKAAIIVLDIAFLPRPGEPNPLEQIFAEEGRPVVAVAEIDRPEGGEMHRVPRLAPNYQALAQSPPPGLTLATGEIEIDPEDGRVRTRFAETCVDDGRSILPLRGIAEAVAIGLGRTQPDPPRCDENAPKPRILFLQSWPIRPPGRLQSGISQLSAADVVPSLPELDGAIVIFGQTHSLARDSYATPIGVMPGVMVHLNAIAGLQLIGPVREAGPGMRFLLQIGLLLLVASVNLAYWTVHDGVIREKPMENSPQGLLLFLVDISVFILVTRFAIECVLALTVYAGRTLALEGMIVGTLVPAFAAVLGAVLEIGKPLVFWLENFVRAIPMITRSLKTRLAGWRGLFMLATAGMLIGPLGAVAQDRVAYVRPEGRTQLKDIQIQFIRDSKPGARTAEEGIYLSAGDYVRILVSGGEATVLAMDHREIARVREGYPVRVPMPGTSTEAPAPGRVMPGRTEASMAAPKPTPASDAAATAGAAVVHTEQLNRMSLDRARQGVNSPATGAAGMAAERPASAGTNATSGTAAAPSGSMPGSMGTGTGAGMGAAGAR